MSRWICAVALVALGCRPGVKSGDGPYADKVAEDIPKIEHAVGLKFKTPPKLEIKTRDQVRAFLVAKFREPAAMKTLANQEAVYKLLGMVPDTMHVEDLFLRVLTEQVVGYYDPKTKVLYVVDGTPEDLVGVTILHELIHALQGQYVNLDSLQALTGDDDRIAAVQAVLEGQATYESSFLIAGGNGNLAAQLPGGWESIRATIRDALKTQPIFSSAPMVIQEGLLFPYINGADFARRYKAARPGKLALTEPPVSTTQVMHDAAYFGTPPNVPSEIGLPAIPGTVYVNTFGEFVTRLFLFQHTRDQDQSIRASGGWDGDRYALIKNGAGTSLVWASAWDTAQDAAEFISAIDAVMRARFNILPLIKGELRHFESKTRSVDVDVREIGGRHVVLYTDVPVGSNSHIIDFSKVTVTAR